MLTEEQGRQNSVEGFANELIAVGILMKRYQNVSSVDLPLSPYDIIIVRKLEDGTEDVIRAQVKTASKNISFTGGTRGGKDRLYLSGVKKYRQSKKTADVVIGVKEEGLGKYSLYFVPTGLIDLINQDSVSLNLIPFLKDNYEALEKCKDDAYITELFKKFMESKKSPKKMFSKKRKKV